MPLRCSERVSLEERTDRLQQILSAPNKGTGRGAHDGCRAAGSRVSAQPRRTPRALRDRRGSAPLELRRTCETPGIRLRSPSGSRGLVAARSRLRSILLRLRNRSPSHGTRSAFPAGFPHPSRCHHGKRHVGRYEVVRDTRVFQHIARCAPCRCRHGGQRLPSRTTRAVQIGHVTLGRL